MDSQLDAGDPADVADSTVRVRLASLLDDLVTTVDCAASGAIFVRSGPTLLIVATTDDTHAALDLTHDGPTSAVFGTGSIARLGSVRMDGPWAEYREACTAVGILSVISVPVPVGGAREAALTIHSEIYHGFGAAEIRTGRAAARAAALLLDGDAATRATPDR